MTPSIGKGGSPIPTMTDEPHANDDETNDEQVHRILVDRGLDGNSKAKLTVAGYSRFS